jgi:Tol biopolymer transport system component
LASLLNAHTRIYMGSAQAPQWSPDGGKIAFTHGGIATIKPNGTSFKVIIPGTSTWIYDGAQWSPTSSHIVFTGYSSSSSNFDLFRATATGGSQTKLTDTPSGNEHSYGGWR